MERCAANPSFKLPVIAISLLVISACAPTLKNKAEINFSLQRYGMRAAGLAYNSSTLELPDDMCYAIHVTSFDNNPTLQRMAPSPNDATCEHGPRGLGLLAGTFAKGSIAELDVPIGPRRRFDLVAMPKSKMPGGTCASGLHAEITGPANTDHNVTLYVGATKLADDDGMRLIARGEVDINPGLVNVVLEAVAVDPKGLEYGCHSGGSGSTGSTTSGPPASGPGSVSEPLARPGNYLQIFLMDPNGNPPAATTHYFVNYDNRLTYPVGGSCSAIGTNVSVFIGSVQADFPCTLGAPFLNTFDNKYYTEGRWGGTMDLSSLSDNPDGLTVDVRETVGGNIFTAYDYTLIDSHAFIPQLYKDTMGPVVYTYTPTNLTSPPRRSYSGGCEAGLPVYIKACPITGGSCPTPGLGEIYASVPCTSGSFNLEILGSTVAGNITFMQKDEAGNANEYTSN